MCFVFRDHTHICITLYTKPLRGSPRRASFSPLQGVLLRPLPRSLVACKITNVDNLRILLYHALVGAPCRLKTLADYRTHLVNERLGADQAAGRVAQKPHQRHKASRLTRRRC